VRYQPLHAKKGKLLTLIDWAIEALTGEKPVRW
jgi:hypothetical protein